MKTENDYNLLGSLVAADAKEVKTVDKKAPPKPKPAAKAPAKPLPRLMEEDVIPTLKGTLEAQDDITELELSFQDNKVSLLVCITLVFLPTMLLITKKKLF